MSKKWQKINLLALVFILGVSLVFTGCGGSQPKSSDSGSNSSAGSAAPSATPQPDFDFYKGKIVNFVVATKAGGGYDTYGRLVAPYIQKYLPGSTVLVKNVPGAGHIIGANEIYNAKPDGLTLGTFNKGLIMSQIAGLEGIKFDMGKFSWLGNISTESRVLVVRSSLKENTLEELAKSGYELKLASAGVGSTSSSDALMLAKMFGLKVKIIQGYEGQAAELAIMKGEIDGTVGGFDSMKNLYDQKQVKVMVVIGAEKIKEVPDAPMLADIAPASYKSAAELLNMQAALARPIAATPGIPEGRLLALESALQQAMNDPELKAKAEKAQLPIAWQPGADVTKSVQGALVQPPDFVTLVKEVVNSAQ